MVAFKFVTFQMIPPLPSLPLFFLVLKEGKRLQPIICRPEQKQTKTKKNTLENLITGRYGPVKSKQTRQGWKKKKTTVQQKLGRKKEKLYSTPVV